MDAAVGGVPETEGPSLKPIAKAVAELAGWSGVDEPQIWNIISRYLPQNRPEDELQVPVVKPASSKEAIALACAFYLAAWEHLQAVNGQRSRDLIFQARLLLDSALETVASTG